MYHTSGLPTLATRGLHTIPTPSTDLDPAVHTFSSYLFSHNEKKLNRTVRTLTSRLKKRDTEIATLRALLAQSTPAPSVVESVDENVHHEHNKGVTDQLIAELKKRQAERRVLSEVTNHHRLPSLNDEVTHHIPRHALLLVSVLFCC
jgi:hypothetical protein